MGVQNIMKSFESAINLVPIISQNYVKTFSQNQNLSFIYVNKTNNLIFKLSQIYGKNANLKFDNINPRKSQALKDNSFKPNFISVKIIF